MSPALRRSVLYLPASNPRALAKARELPADGLIFDLEDAVAPEAKPQAREQLREALAAGGYPGERVVRVNGADTPWGSEDLRLAAGLAIDAVALPKVEHPYQIGAAAATLEDAGADRLDLWALLETPRGVLNAQAIAHAHPRLRVLVMGTQDLSRAARIPPSPGRLGLLPALGLCVLAARAAGLDILDGVHPALDDPAGLVRSCEQARTLGFDGKTLIHPKQIETANRAFGPAPEQLDRARHLVAAWDDSHGVAVVDGQMVERLHVEEARRLLELAALIEARQDRA